MRIRHLLLEGLSFAYWVVRRLFELLILFGRSERAKELEILMLRHELQVLRRQVGRPRLRSADRVLLAAFGQLLPRGRRSFLVQPATLLRWHRDLVRRRWSYPGRRPGRPPLVGQTQQLILRLAAENPSWGYKRIQGELVALGMPLSASSVWNVLHRHGIDPASRRASASWREFLRQQAAAMVECDFFTVETLRLRRFYVLFFIELSRRRVYLAGITANPDGAWVVQQARNLTMTLAEQKQSDRILIVSRRQLETVLREYVAYYNTHRPHRSLDQQPPLPKVRPVPPPDHEWRVRRHDRLGGLLHEYELAA